MNHRVWIANTAAVCLVILPWQTASEGQEKSKDVFGLTRTHALHLEVSAKEWEAMQPAVGMPPFGFGPGGPKKPPVKAADKAADVHKGGSFGIEFPWVKAELTAYGVTYKNVGLRYKGGGSYLPSAGKLKRNLKIELDRYEKKQRFHGLKTITLNSGVTDPTRFREVLAYSVYRAAGVPSPRTALAQVTLTVPGKYDKEFVGMYTLVEAVDKTFLKDRFKNNKGLLLKPERRPGIMKGPFDYAGEDWDAYKASLGPKRTPSKAEAKRVIEFLRLVNKADDQQFRKEIGSYLDVDEFLRFLAATALVCNMDSIFTIGHNCLIYLNPETNRFVFIPWDLDLAYGGGFMFGGPDQQANLSLTHPYLGHNKLVERLLAWKDVSEQYQNLLKELAKTSFTKDRLLQDLDALAKATKEISDRETKAARARKEGTGFGPPMFGPTTSLRTFVEKRVESVAAQLAGKSKGYVPAPPFGFGPGPKGFGPPPQPGLIPGFLQERLNLTAEQKAQIENLHKEMAAKMEKILTSEQRKMLQEMMRKGPPGFGPPGGFPDGPQPFPPFQPRKEGKP